LETIKGKASITQEILPVMEKNLLDAILPSVFRDSCINSRRLMERDTHNRRRLSMIGASAKPDDTISTDGKNNFVSIKKGHSLTGHVSHSNFHFPE
jgi:hypothetical protein